MHHLADYTERYEEFISTFLSSQATGKSQQLFSKIKQVNQRVDLISSQSQVIERDAFIEFTHILERLNLAEGKKVSIL